MSKRAEEAALKAYHPTYTTVKRHAKRVQSELVDTHKPVRAIFQQGYEQAEKETIQRIKELLKVRIVERTERCQEDWSNRQKDRVNIRNDEDGDIILVLEKLEEE